MKTFCLNPDFPSDVTRYGVLAIGNFDGVHRGHQSVIRTARALAEDYGTHCAVMTFEPYPREFFQGDQAPARLTGLRQKLGLLKHHGVDLSHCLKFNQSLASTTAEDFIRRFLVERLAVRHVIVGRDFQFGAKRQGNIETLTKSGAVLGFAVNAIDDFVVSDQRVSSSLIRALLAEGELEQASALLGRPVTHIGRVLHGDKRGRQWGFPTANLLLPRHSSPLRGVFVIEASDDHGWKRYGVANLGRRPTVDGLKLLLEAHLFDCTEDLYGKLMEIRFLHKIRDEQRFEKFDDLKAQIMRDVQFGKRWITDNR